MISHLSKTPEYSYLENYSKIRQRLENNLNIEKGFGKELVDKLNSRYSNLLEILREYNEHPSEKIRYIERSLYCLSNLLITWNKYVEILYLSDKEIEIRTNEAKISLRELRKFVKNNDDIDLDEIDYSDYIDEIGSHVLVNKELKSEVHLKKVSDINSKFIIVYNCL